MITLNTLIQLKKRLPKEAWSWAFMALRQDDVVWNSLSEAAFSRRALETLGANPARWSPASLALLALGEQIRLEELCATPIRPLAQPLRSRAIRAYEAWLKTTEDGISLAQAGLLALSLRERRRLKGSWEGIAAELRSTEPGARKGAARRAAQTIVACLYGMAPDSFDLLRAICTTSLAQPRLALHALFSTPMPPEQQVEQLHKLLAELPNPQRQVLLRDLASLRPWLAAQLTQDYLQNTPVDEALTELNAEPEKQGELIASLLQQAELRQIASQPEQEAALLDQSVQAAQRLQGYALARLAQATWQASLAAGNGDQAEKRAASLATWRQAVDLAPDSPDHPARLARALMEVGRQDEAHRLLENWLDGDRLLAHPALALVTAMLADQQGDLEAMQTAAGAALKLVENGQSLDQDGYVLLAQLLLQAELAEGAVQAACLGLERYPLNRDLLELRAQAGYALGEHDQTLGDAYLVMAIEQSAKTQDGLEAMSVIGRGDFFRKPWQLGARRGLRRLLVESLEAAGEWHEALDERLMMMDEIDDPSSEDWHDLARCALKAGKPDQAMSACRKALQLNANDDQAHRVLGEAALQTGDLTSALEHLHQAVRLSPQQADLWLTLAGAHRKAGQVTQVLDVLRAASLAVPDNAQVHLALGEAYLDQKALTQALPSLQKAASLEPDNARIGLVYGQTMSQLGHLNQAKDILKGAYKSGCGGGIEIIRNGDEEDELEYDVEVAYAYAKVLLALGEYREAVDILEEIVHLQPENPEPPIDLARALIKIGGSAATIETAIAFLKKAILLCIDLKHQDPSKTAYASQLQVEALTLLAEAYAALGDYPASAETYQEAMQAQEASKVVEQSRLALGYSRVALQLGQHKEAITALKNALEADPRNLALQRAMSEAYLADGSVQQAMQAARKVLDLKPYDLDTLTWFAEMGLRQQNLSGEEAGIARAEVIRTLQEATQLAPYRGDLLFNLARLLLEDGDGPAALAALRKLAGAEDEEHPVSTDDLYQAAKASRGLGDGMLAISLLRRAVEGLASAPAPEAGLVEARSAAQPISGAALPVNLYYELALAYQQAGMLQAALEAVERALELDPNRLALHLYKADLLDELQMPEQTLESLRQALRLDPVSTALHYRAALLLNQLGNLSGALEHAGQAALTVNDLDEPELAHAVRMMAASLAYSMLRSQEAWVYLKEELSSGGPACQHEDHACVRVSLALDSHQPEMAADDVAWISAASPDQPHSLALQARLAAAQGDQAGGFEFFKSALRAWMAQAARQAEKTAAEAAAAKAPAKISSTLGLRMLCQAAQELGQWEDAITLARRLVDRQAQEPLAHMLLAQALIRRAEVQRLNLDLDVRQHAPGAQALSDEALQAVEQALATAERLAAILIDPESGDPLPGIGDESVQVIELWRLRGQAVFNPELHTAQAFSRAIGSAHVDADGAAALVMALRKAWEGSGEADRGGQSHRIPEWIASLKGLAVFQQADQALPLIQMALSLEKSDPGRALEMVNQAQGSVGRASATRRDVPQPMLDFFIARLSLATGALTAAQQSIEKALAEWPDEARWRLLAAQIYQQREASAGLPDPAKAIAHLEKAVFLEADYAPHHLALGRLYLRSGDAQRAGRSLEQAAALLPDRVEAWLELAQAQQQLGDLDQAAASAEKAIELSVAAEGSGNPTPALLLRGDIALKANNPRGALNRVQVVLRNQPDHPEALHLLSRTLEALNRPAEALAALERAMQRMEDPFPLQVARVELLRRAQGPEAALLAMEDLTQRYPQQIVLQALMAEWSFEAGRDEAGVQAAQLALQSANGQLSLERQARLQYLVGLNMRKQGQLDAAVHHMSQAIQLAPEVLDAYLELGQIHQERREYKQALKVYQRAMSVAPKDFRPYYQSGQVLKDSKDYLAAETMLRRAAQMAPDEVSIHRLLGAVVALNLVHNQKL
ncbi:MAG: tetratricopeptide repeat protein [Anaerolineales bacterium]|nr:tetratricopeptide repeat protein [Anaerolineales bacterium]